VALAAMVAWHVAGILWAVSDPLSQTVELVFQQGESFRAGGPALQPAGALVIVTDTAPNPAATGIGMALLAFHLGGVPGAALASMLARRGRRRRPWTGPVAASCFRVGFVLQAGCALAAIMLLGLFGGLLMSEARSPAELAGVAPYVVLLALWCLPHAFVSVWALRFWRELQIAASAASRAGLLRI
jgi:hypothetical protein